MNTYESNTIRIAFLAVGCLFAQPSPAPAETAEQEAPLCRKLDPLLLDPHVAILLEARADGVILRIQSADPVSQKAAKAFAIELLKQHQLSLELPTSNGYGLPEQ